MVRVIIFDIDGVVNTYTPAGYRQYLADKSGLSFDITKKLVQPYIDKLVLNELTLDEFEYRVANELKIDKKDVRWIEYYKTFTLNPDVEKIIEQLIKKGYKIAFFTNTDRSRYYLTIAHLSKFSDMIFAASYIGLSKPDKKAYEYVVNEINKKLTKKVAYGEIVFIDDSEINVEAAKALGMHGILFRNASELNKEITEILKIR